MATQTPPHDSKAMAHRLRAALAERGFEVGHSQALDLVARTLGARDWNTYVAQTRTRAESPRQPVVPLLRMIDWTSTRRFYVEFLKASVDWIDEAGDHTPRYVAVTLASGARLHLSEHHGDGTPGASLLVTVSDLDDQLAALTAADFGASPAIAQSRLGRSITVHDPMGNRIIFVSADQPAHRVPDDLPPIVNEVILRLRPAEAFDRFTSFSWWQDYGLADDGHVSIDDGDVVFHNPDGDMSIGRVLIWEPGARYAQTFTLAQDADDPTTLTATFEAVAAGTRLRVEHGGWTATNASRRAHFSDWPLILSRLAR